MEIGSAGTSKYSVQVYAVTSASKVAGTIHCNTKEEYENLLEENFDQLHEDGYFNINCTNDFDIGDIELDEFDFEKDAKYYENK